MAEIQNSPHYKARKARPLGAPPLKTPPYMLFLGEQ